MEMKDDRPSVVFRVTEDHIDSLKYIPKASSQVSLLSPLFLAFESEFEKRDCDAFVPAFLKFYAKALSVPLLRPAVVKLKDILISLLTKCVEGGEIQAALDDIAGLSRVVMRRVYLLESDEIGLILSILSLVLSEFDPATAKGSIRFIAENIVNLVITFMHNPGRSDFGKVKEMALGMEDLVDLCSEGATLTEETKPKFWDIINSVFRLVPCDVMGSLTPKMNLLLLLYHAQPAPA
jgi:hypothetical protein